MFFLLHIRAAGQNLPSFDETQPTGPLKIIIPDEIFIFVITRIKLFFPSLPSFAREFSNLLCVFSSTKKEREESEEWKKKEKRIIQPWHSRIFFLAFAFNKTAFKFIWR